MPPNDLAEQGIELLRRGYEAMSRGDLLAFAKYLPSDFIINMPFELSEPMFGSETWAQNAKNMAEGFSDIQPQIDDIFGAGDRVAVRLTYRARHTGTFLGIPPTGRRVEFRSVELYRFEKPDSFAEEWVYPDLAGLMRQITEPAPS